MLRVEHIARASIPDVARFHLVEPMLLEQGHKLLPCELLLHSASLSVIQAGGASLYPNGITQWPILYTLRATVRDAPRQAIWSRRRGQPRQPLPEFATLTPPHPPASSCLELCSS